MITLPDLQASRREMHPAAFAPEYAAFPEISAILVYPGGYFVEKHADEYILRLHYQLVCNTDLAGLENTILQFLNSK